MAAAKAMVAADPVTVATVPVIIQEAEAEAVAAAVVDVVAAVVAERGSSQMSGIVLAWPPPSIVCGLQKVPATWTGCLGNCRYIISGRRSSLGQSSSSRHRRLKPSSSNRPIDSPHHSNRAMPKPAPLMCSNQTSRGLRAQQHFSAMQ